MYLPTPVLRYDQRAQAYRLPDANHERTALAEAVGRDGFQVLAGKKREHCRSVAAQRASHGRRVTQVWEEQYAGPPEGLRWRNQGDLPVRASAPLESL